MNIQRLSSFCDGNTGGNPAGVLISDHHPSEHDMQSIAAEVGYSETAFVTPNEDSWRVRYFSPESEVPFCGHATIALGAALAKEHGPRVFPLVLNETKITVVFGYTSKDLDSNIPPARANGGAEHLIIGLNSQAALSSMKYDLNEGRTFMRQAGLVTVMFVYAESDQLFHSRNPFASGGVYEDPATGAASAAFAGYLRDLKWPHSGKINIVQGEDMGSRSLVKAEFSDQLGTSIRISGAVRKL